MIRPLDPVHVLRRMAEYHHVQLDDVLSDARWPQCVRARDAAAAVLRAETMLSWEEIGRVIGRKPGGQTWARRVRGMDPRLVRKYVAFAKAGQ
jgi:hypothetical protein